MIQEDTTDVWFFCLDAIICDKQQVDFSGTGDSMAK